MKKLALSVVAAVAATFAQANSWTYSGNKSSSGGTITDGTWTINVDHDANADTVSIGVKTTSATVPPEDDHLVLDLTGDITTKDNQVLQLVGITGAHHGYMAIANKKVLQTVILPEGFTSIGAQAFQGCTALTTVTFPSTLQTIGGNSFDKCSSLQTLVGFAALENVTVGGSAFRSCTSLVIDEWPAKMQIGGDAFNGCAALKKATVAAGTLAKGAFSGCESLEEIEIGKGVTDITGVLVGSGSPSLKTIRCLGYPSGTLYCGTLSGTGDYAFFGRIDPSPATYALRVFVPDVADWRTYFANAAASSKSGWENAPAGAKTAYEELYPDGPTPDLYRYYNKWGGFTYAWVIFEEPLVSESVTLTIDSNVKIDGKPVGNATPDFGAGLEYEVGNMPTCTIEPVAYGTNARFDAYGCELSKLVEGEWTVLSTNETLSFKITGEKSGEEYRLVWLFNRAYEPNLAKVPTLFGERLGTVKTNSSPNVGGTYYAVGTTVSFEAKSGTAPFVRWYGACVPAGHERDNPISFAVNGPIDIKAFFRSSRFMYTNNYISDGYLACRTEFAGDGVSELVIKDKTMPPDADFDFTKPIFDANGKEYTIVRSDVGFFRFSFDGEDPADSARRIRYPKTLDRNGLTASHQFGSSTSSYRFIDFGGDLTYSTLTNTEIGVGNGLSALSILLTIPRGAWGDILDYPDRFTPWSSLSASERAKWRNLNIPGHRPIGVTRGMWVRYDDPPGFSIIVR